MKKASAGSLSIEDSLKYSCFKNLATIYMSRKDFHESSKFYIKVKYKNLATICMSRKDFHESSTFYIKVKYNEIYICTRETAAFGGVSLSLRGSAAFGGVSAKNKKINLGRLWRPKWS